MNKIELRQLGWSDELIDSVSRVAILVQSGAIAQDYGLTKVDLFGRNTGATSINLAHTDMTGSNRLTIEQQSR